MTGADPMVLERAGIDFLIAALRGDGFVVVGPTVRDAAIVLDEITSSDDLPEGWTDDQEAGSYRLRRRADRALFGHVVGPQAFKRFLHPPEARLFALERTADGGFRVERDPLPAPRFAFLGVRSCDLHAMQVQDRVFLESGQVDPIYAARRRQAFVVAVDCGTAGKTCFCVSMNTGPRAEAGFDLALTELLDGGRHEFLVRAASDAGRALLARLPARGASTADERAAEAAVDRARGQMGRRLETTGLKELLAGNLEHPRFDALAERCLACANCTLVCPTCFCSDVVEVPSLDRERSERRRVWDSCFNLDFSHLHGGSVRPSVRARYRQWLTHKLSTWHDQFGTSGCVGCGRCITWCPVGIDLTEEAAAIRADDRRGREGAS